MSDQQKRFRRWLLRDDAVKEAFLAEIGGSLLSEGEAIDLVNRSYCAQPAGDSVIVRERITPATVRMWTKDDDEFAQAYKVAKRVRDEGRRLGLDRPAYVSPELAPAYGRLDQRFDPWRVFGYTDGTQ